MRKITALFLLATALLTAQNHRFMYEYRFVPDLTNPSDIKKELMVLDVEQQKSVYYSYERFRADSAAQADVARQVATGSTNINIQRRERTGAVNYKVEKQHPDFKTDLITNIGSDRYRVTETAKPQWKIFGETQKVGEYTAQKAETEFGGRKWTAWFTTDLPFQDGPYKFYGLPGLIVKLSDESETHTMVLVAVKKTEPVKAKAEDLTGTPGRVLPFMGKEMVITESQFKKLWKEYTNDPAKSMREMMMKSTPENQVVVKMRTADGRELSDPREVLKNMETRVKEMLKKNNNPIEPDLYY